MLKTELIAAARDQWAKTEASITQAAASGKYEEKGPSGWSAGDCYRHLVDVAHKLPEAIEALRAGQQPVLHLHRGDGDARDPGRIPGRHVPPGQQCHPRPGL